MIKYLIDTQAGFVSPKKFKLDEITKRSYGLKLSRHLDIENVHSAGVNTLAIETAENR